MRDQHYGHDRKWTQFSQLTRPFGNSASSLWLMCHL